MDRALTVARTNGLAAVSMRRLARELGVQPMSLYYHIPSRAVLMVLMASRSVSGLPRPDPATAWDERLVTLLRDTYRAGVEDPALFPVLASESLGAKTLPPMEPDTGAASAILIEQVVALLAEGGVAPDARLQACRALIGLVVGFLVGQVDGLSSTMDDPSESNRPADADLPSTADLPSEATNPARTGPQRSATVPATLRAMHVDDPLQDLSYALRLFVRGLRAEVRQGLPAADRSVRGA